MFYYKNNMMQTAPVKILHLQCLATKPWPTRKDRNIYAMIPNARRKYFLLGSTTLTERVALKGYGSL